MISAADVVDQWSKASVAGFLKRAIDGYVSNDARVVTAKFIGTDSSDGVIALLLSHVLTVTLFQSRRRHKGCCECTQFGHLVHVDSSDKSCENFQLLLKRE